MKQIGIKQADGSFYPIMEEGSPVKKTLGLTTAKDNQTRVLVDLYRSKTGTIDEAEYVDSLQIDNLVAHAKGSSEIKLNISLDENGKLSAELIDPETGATSSADVTLVSRTLEERLMPTEFGLAVGNQESNPIDLPADLDSGKTVEADSLDEPEPEVADMPDFDLPDFGTDTVSPDETVDFATDDVLESVDTTESSGDVATEIKSADSSENKDEDSVSTDIASGAAAGGLMAVAATLRNENSNDESAGSIDSSAANNALPEKDSTAMADSFADDSVFDLPDFDTEVSPEFAKKTGENSETFDLPDFGDSDSTVSIDSTVSSDETDSKSSFGETNFSESEDFSLDLPDFDSDPVESDSKIDSSADDSIFGDNSFLDNFEVSDEQPDPDSTAEMIKQSSALKFDNLYDKETMEGDSSVGEEEEVEKEFKIPTIICIICAAICIIAVLLILFVVPSKCNILSRLATAKEKTSVVETVEDEPEVQEEAIPEEIAESEPEPEAEPESEPEPEIVEAKEDEIVVVEEPEKVVPETPKTPEVQPEDITYKIKWGDTLWDIADAYYKNPWNYKKIARYNGIRNPDYIISGTYIKIPAK